MDSGGRTESQAISEINIRRPPHKRCPSHSAEVLVIPRPEDEIPAIVRNQREFTIDLAVPTERAHDDARPKGGVEVARRFRDGVEVLQLDAALRGPEGQIGRASCRERV